MRTPIKTLEPPRKTARNHPPTLTQTRNHPNETGDCSAGPSKPSRARWRDVQVLLLLLRSRQNRIALTPARAAAAQRTRPQQRSRAPARFRLLQALVGLPSESCRNLVRDSTRSFSDCSAPASSPPPIRSRAPSPDESLLRPNTGRDDAAGPLEPLIFNANTPQDLGTTPQNSSGPPTKF